MAKKREKCYGISLPKETPLTRDALETFGVPEWYISIIEELRNSDLPKRNREKRENDIQGFVYVIQAHNLYKIGKAQNLQKRFQDLSVNSAIPIFLYGFIQTSDTHTLEKELHEKFCRKRMHGEWFSLDKTDLLTLEKKYKLQVSREAVE